MHLFYYAVNCYWLHFYRMTFLVISSVIANFTWQKCDFLLRVMQVSSSLITLDIFVSYTLCWPINNPISLVTLRSEYPNHNCKFAGDLQRTIYKLIKLLICHIPIFWQYCFNQATEHKMSCQSFVNITLMPLPPKQCPDNHSDPKKRNRPKPVTMQCFLNSDYIRAFAIEILQLGLVSQLKWTIPMIISTYMQLYNNVIIVKS